MPEGAGGKGSKLEVEELWWKALDFAALKRSSVSFFDVQKPETAISRWARARKMALFGVGQIGCRHRNMAHEFKTKIELFSKLRHLLSLLGYCKQLVQSAR